MKVCSRCKLGKPLDSFNKNRANKDGLQRFCRACHVLSTKSWVDRNPDKRREQLKRRQAKGKPRGQSRDGRPEQRAAHDAVEIALAQGLLVRPDVCPTCRDRRYRVQAHHDDYSKPLDVEWLCAKCHGRLHRRSA